MMIKHIDCYCEPFQWYDKTLTAIVSHFNGMIKHIDCYCELFQWHFTTIKKIIICKVLTFKCQPSLCEYILQGFTTTITNTLITISRLQEFITDIIR